MKKQLAYILARNQISLPQDVLDRYESSEADAALIPILNNAELKTHFTNFAKTLNLHEPPLSLEDVYKSHLDDNPSPRNAPSTSNVDSARQNLAGTFVNAFVNVGCANDKLMAAAEEGQSWIYKNKDSGMLSAAASLGLSYLWDADEGLSSIDPFSHATEEYIKAGALLGNGLVHSGIRSEMDAALALLSEYTESQSVPMRTSAITGCVHFPNAKFSLLARLSLTLSGATVSALRTQVQQDKTSSKCCCPAWRTQDSAWRSAHWRRSA